MNIAKFQKGKHFATLYYVQQLKKPFSFREFAPEPWPGRSSRTLLGQSPRSPF